MSEYLGSAVLEMRANLVPLARGLGEAEKMTQRSLLAMDGNVGRRMASMSMGMSRVGGAMSRTLTIPILGVAAASSKMAIDFNRAMELIHTQAGASQREVERLKGSVLDLAKVTPFGPTKLAEGLYHLESIGLRGAHAMTALKIAAQGAAVGNTDLEHTATALGSAWLVNIKGAGKLHSANNLLMKGVGSLHQVMGVLNATVGVGNMRMSDLVTSLGTGLLPMAKRAGLSLQDMMGALAVFSDEGYKAYSAATQMGTALHYLYDPTAKAANALNEIGLSSGQLAGDMHKPRGLLVALSDLQKHLDATFPGGSAQKLTVGETTKAVDAFRASLEKSGMSAKSVNTQVDKYKAKLKDLGTAQVAQEAVLGDIFPAGRGRVLSVLMNQLTRYDQKLNQIDKGTKKFGPDIRATMEQPAVQIQTAWSGLQAELTKFGEHALPPLLAAGKEAVSAIDGIFNSFDRLSPGMQKAIIDGGLLVAAIGPALKIASFFLGGITKLAGIASIAAKLALGRGWAGATGRGPGLGASTGAAMMEVAEMNVARMVVASMTGMGATGLPAGFRPRNAKGQFLPGYSQSASSKPYQTAPATPSTPSSGTGVVSPGAAAATTQREASMLSRAGGIALRGLGALGVAAFAIPIGIGLEHVIGSFIQNQAEEDGRKFAQKFLAPLPQAIQDKFEHPITKAAQKVLDLRQRIADSRNTFNTSTPAGVTPGPTPAAAFSRALRKSEGKSNVSPADRRALEEAATKLGRLTGEATIKGLQSVKDPSTFVLFRDFHSQLAKLPAQARPEAAKVMVEYAMQLQKSGKIPAAAVGSLIRQLTDQFGPKFRASLFVQGVGTDKAVAKSLKFDAASRQLKNTLDDFRTTFGDFAISTKITGDNVNQNATRAFTDLHKIIKTSVGKTRQDAIAELHKLQAASAATFDAMLGKTVVSMNNLTKFIQAGTSGAARVGSHNMWAFAGQVGAAMNAGQIGTKTGVKLIAKALNAGLKAFGSKELPVPVFDSAAIVAVGVGRGAATGALGAAGAAGQGAVAGLPGQNLPTPAGAGAAGRGAASGAGAARGMLMQVGRPGERGHDAVPMSVGGADIVVGRGEKVAVFNAEQQRAINADLAHRGGLSGFFAGRRWKPHYMAGGGVVESPGVNMSVGSEPQILADLRALSRELGETVTVISGYRSPAHSVAVGGFADDPHTRGQAADIALASLSSLTDAELAKVGLYRPFYPADPHEINHVQLLGSGPSGGGAGGAGALFRPWKNIKAPHLRGRGTVPDLVRTAMGRAVGAANRYGRSHTGGGSFAGTLSGSVEHQIFQFFKAAGMNKIAIAGLIGNAAQESNLNWSTPGGGMWQQISNFGQGAPSPLVQMSTMLGQIRASGVLAAMNAAGSPAAAATIFEQQFERPNAALANMPHRIAAANAAYASGYAGGGIVLGDYDHPYPAHSLYQGGTKLRPSVVAQIFEAAGMPGWTMADIAHGESEYEPGVVEGIESIGIGGVPVRGWGIVQQTTGVGGDSIINRFGGPRALLNPVRASHAAKALGDEQGIGVAWARSRYLGATNKHWKGPPPSNANHHAAPSRRGRHHRPYQKYASGPASHALARAALRLPNPAKVMFRHLNALLGAGGSSGSLPDLIDFTSQRDDVIVQQWADRVPGLDTSTGLVTPEDGSKPYLDTEYISMRVNELHQLLAWQTQVRNTLLKAKKKLSPLISYLREQIRKRKAQQVHIREQIRKNVREIHHLTRSLDAIRAEKKPVSTGELDRQKLVIEKRLRSERAKSEPFPSPKTQAQRVANAKFHHDQRVRENALENAYTALGVSATSKNETAAQAQRKREQSLEGAINALKADNQKLGGDTLRIGTGGQLRALKLPVFENELKTALGDKTSLLGPSGIGGLLGEAQLSLSRTGTIPSELYPLGAAQQATNLDEAMKAWSGGQPDSPLASLLEQQNLILEQQYSVSQAQYQVLAQMPPFGGSFEYGGIVPGPMGAPRTIIAHGGEEFAGVGNTFGSDVHLHFRPGTEWLKDFVDVRVERQTRQQSRNARRPLPGRGGG